MFLRTHPRLLSVFGEGELTRKQSKSRSRRRLGAHRFRRSRLLPGLSRSTCSKFWHPPSLFGRVLLIFQHVSFGQCYAVGTYRMILLRLQQLILLVFVTYTIALAAVWSKVSRVFKITRKAESELDSDTFVRLSSDTKNNRNILRALASSAQSMLSGRSSYDYHLALEDDVNDMKELGTAAGHRFHLSGLADWIEAPRDAANLPHIIQATRSQDPCEKEYAFGEMLKVVERLDPLAHVTLVDSALSCVVDWIKERPLIERHVSMVLDPLPLLVDYASRHESLRRHIDPMIAYLVRELGYPAVLLSNLSMIP
ncbi:hypothetical protein Y032_0032g2592 [Ancylostoma ceylanicum]|uniref:Uncharacterized protein n=1 Tax=Ancylostoma ceylanicum TaxID=53326 RepID=A0A016UP66_9BILA|nr:hypothetical protein Y032_0032g2592 [Ancylostoma ceylanicum]